MKASLRRDIILEIINEFEVNKQEEIVELLLKRGVSATQATVSRDIKELGLQKVKGNKLKTKYSVQQIVQNDDVSNDKIIILLKTFILSVENAKNLVVVKTISGNGSACGMAIDKLKIDGVVGSIAGDDTLLIVTHEDEDAKKVVEHIKSLI